MGIFHCDTDPLMLFIVIHSLLEDWGRSLFKHPLTFLLVISFSIELFGIRSQGN